MSSSITVNQETRDEMQEALEEYGEAISCITAVTWKFMGYT